MYVYIHEHAAGPAWSAFQARPPALHVAGPSGCVLCRGVFGVFKARMKQVRTARLPSVWLIRHRYATSVWFIVERVAMNCVFRHAFRIEPGIGNLCQFAEGEPVWIAAQCLPRCIARRKRLRAPSCKALLGGNFARGRRLWGDHQAITSKNCEKLQVFRRYGLVPGRAMDQVIPSNKPSGAAVDQPGLRRCRPALPLQRWGYTSRRAIRRRNPILSV